ASSLARPAVARKSRSRGSFSKYSTRHGAESVSISLFGNSSFYMRIATETKILRSKVERAFRFSFHVIPSEAEESLEPLRGLSSQCMISSFHLLDFTRSNMHRHARSSD